MRSILTALAVFLAFPVWGQEEAEHPYKCLSVWEADAIHIARNDVLVASREQGRAIEFVWATEGGKFFIVEVDRPTLIACIVKLTPYDPRNSVSG